MPVKYAPFTGPSASATWVSRTLPSAAGSLVESVPSSRVPLPPSSSGWRITPVAMGRGFTRTLTRRWQTNSQRLRFLLHTGQYYCARSTFQRRVQTRRSPLWLSSRYVNKFPARSDIDELTLLFPPLAQRRRPRIRFLSRCYHSKVRDSIQQENLIRIRGLSV